MKLKKQFDVLLTELNSEKHLKSSHWQYYLRNFDVKDDLTIDGDLGGFGEIQPLSPLRKIFNNFFLIILFGKDFLFTDLYKIFKNIENEQNKCIDINVIRHYFTFEFLQKKIFTHEKIDNVCVIGDGRCNFVSPALKSNIFNKIISVNLTEVLLFDLLLLEKQTSINKNEIGVASSINQFDDLLKNKDIKLILISAQNSHYLVDKKISLFVNICSFQEMTLETINEYFDIIKSNNSFFYCCNRVYKKLIGGEVTEFAKYNWGNARIIIDELCPWSQRFYGRKFPFIFKCDGEVQHRLIKY